MRGSANVCTNTYVIYCRFYELEKEKKQHLPKKMTHVKFLMEIALTLLPEGLLHAPHESASQDEVYVVSSLVSEGSKTRPYMKREYERIATLKKSSKERVLKKKVTIMIDKKLANKFPHRIDGRFHLLINVPVDHYKPCQYCMHKEINVGKMAGEVDIV